MVYSEKMPNTSLQRSGTGDLRRLRQRMCEALRARGIVQESVLQAMRSVPRHLFVPQALQWQAYEDNSLPIGYGQTISRP